MAAWRSLIRDVFPGAVSSGTAGTRWSDEPAVVSLSRSFASPSAASGRGNRQSISGHHVELSCSRYG